jgi:hypothetical protein
MTFNYISHVYTYSPCVINYLWLNPALGRGGLPHGHGNSPRFLTGFCFADIAAFMQVPVILHGLVQFLTDSPRPNPVINYLPQRLKWNRLSWQELCDE